MASGFFQGGMSEGIASANKQMLAEQTLAADTGLRQRALNLTEQQMRNSQQQQGIERFDKQIADTMSVVAETIKSATAVGRDPQTIMKAVAPLVQSAKAIAGRVGRDPNALDAQVQALLVNPNAVETAATAGAAAATQAVTQDATERRLLQAQQPGTEPELPRRYKSASDKTSAENSLRDDYIKNSKDFVTIRDAKQRLDTIEKTGAGDMALVFQYMKLLDPTSTVREGEYATAVNAAGVPSAITALYNRVTGGGTLDDKARAQIKSQANKFYQSAAAQHDKMTTQYASTAKRQGLNPNNVIIDQKPVERPDPLKIR